MDSYFVTFRSVHRLGRRGSPRTVTEEIFAKIIYQIL